MELFKRFLYQFDDTVNAAEASNTQKYEKKYIPTTESELSTLYDDENEQETTEKPNYEIIYYNPNTNVDNHSIKELKKRHKKQDIEKFSSNCQLNKDKDSEVDYTKTRNTQDNLNSMQKTAIMTKERKNFIPKENNNGKEFDGVVIALPNINAKQLHKLLTELRRRQLKLN